MSARLLRTAATLCALTVTLPSVATAKSCARPAVSAAVASVVPTKNLNQNLFNQAVLGEVNYERCRAGLPALSLASGLMNVADNHAQWMVKSRKLSHQSTVRGQESVQQRVLASGSNIRRGSENIGNLPRYQFSGTRKVYVNNIRQCNFTSASGAKIQPHSYATLATEIVGMWMGSPRHRKNVLDQNVHTVGSAIQFDRRASHCGQFFLSQNFAG